MIEYIENDLRSLADPQYKVFQAKLMPTVCSDLILGVRTPDLRNYAKNMRLDAATQFMELLPHKYYEENNLHGFLIESIEDYHICISQLDAFLPHIDNWATCDGTKPKCFKKNKKHLIIKISQWLTSNHEFTVRYGILMLMTHYLDSDFKEEYLAMVSALNREEYYIRMMIAWYFATALAKRWDYTIVYLQGKKLHPWVHNKTIQKAVESYRITPEQKAYLRTLRV